MKHCSCKPAAPEPIATDGGFQMNNCTHIRRHVERVELLVIIEEMNPFELPSQMSVFSKGFMSELPTAGWIDELSPHRDDLPMYE